MAIKKLTITKVYINHESKDKKPFITEKGKKFWKVAIQVDEKEYQGEYLSNLIFDEDSPMFLWKPGHTVSLIIERNGQYLNFKLPDRLAYLEERVEALENLLNEGKGPQSESKEPKILGTDEDDIFNQIPF